MNTISTISTLYSSEPALLVHLKLAGRASLDASKRGDIDERTRCADEIDSITDRLAERGLCRKRGDCDDAFLSAERKRLKAAYGRLA